MIYFLKPLPEPQRESEKWVPFREKEWLKKYFMLFVYVLQGILLFLSISLGIWNYFGIGAILLLLILTFVTHELLHIVVVYRAGDISITYHGGFFLWMTPDAVLSKGRYWMYMTFPLIMLTVFPQIGAIFVTGKVRNCLVVISWLNAIIAGADILDSMLILSKPPKSVFWRGRYKAPV